MALWSIPNQELITWFSKGGYTITSVVFLCRHGMLASVDMGGVLTLWTVGDRHPIFRVAAHDARIWGIAACADQRFLVTAGADQRVVIWDLESLQIANEYRMNSSVTACVFHGDSIIVGNRNGSLRIFDYGKASRYQETHESISDFTVEDYRIVAFIDGNLGGPIREYSRHLLYALNKSELPYVVKFVGSTPLQKQSLTRLSGCPLFPQLYLDGRFLGGSEVVSEMVEAGALQRLFEQHD